jgi:hypothetical protein
MAIHLKEKSSRKEEDHGSGKGRNWPWQLLPVQSRVFRFLDNQVFEQLLPVDAEGSRLGRMLRALKVRRICNQHPKYLRLDHNDYNHKVALELDTIFINDKLKLIFIYSYILKNFQVVDYLTL